MGSQLDAPNVVAVLLLKTECVDFYIFCNLSLESPPLVPTVPALRRCHS